MGFRIWLDDIRPMPEGFNFWAKTVDDAKAKILCQKVDMISFDHDLGQKETGYDLAKFIENMAAYHNIDPITWQVHSANPVGRKNIEMAMKSAERFWYKGE